MPEYNPPAYTVGSDPIELTPAEGQSLADLDGTTTDAPVSTREYYAPSSWCTTYVDPMSGMEYFKLKDGYLTPDGLLRYRLGHHNTEPDPAQMGPVDLSDFRVIQPHGEDPSIGDGVNRPLWYSVKEPAPGPGAKVPVAWLSSNTWDDIMSGATVTVLKEDYLTPGLMDLYDRNSAQVMEPPEPVKGNRKYTLPDVEGVSWEVDGEPADPGEHTVEVGEDPVIVEILPIAEDGYMFEPPASVVTFTFMPDDEPGPDPEPDPDTGEDEAIAIMARLLGADTSVDEMIGAFNIVRLFVMEYTRGRGFSEAGKPVPGLLAVIAAGAIRLVTNPEQAELYSLDGVTIRPAVFQGYTMAEQKVLHNYRKRFA